MIVVYGDMDLRNNVEDSLGKLKQMTSMTTYILMFSEHATQCEWNQSNLVAQF